MQFASEVNIFCFCNVYTNTGTMVPFITFCIVTLDPIGAVWTKTIFVTKIYTYKSNKLNDVTRVNLILLEVSVLVLHAPPVLVTAPPILTLVINNS